VLHAFTGNDYTSAFHGVEKVRAFKAMRKDDNFISTFEKIGDSFIFDALCCKAISIDYILFYQKEKILFIIS